MTPGRYPGRRVRANRVTTYSGRGTVLKLVWRKDGALDISGNLKTDAYDVETNSLLGADDILGHHLLAFP